MAPYPPPGRFGSAGLVESAVCRHLDRMDGDTKSPLPWRGEAAHLLDAAAVALGDPRRPGQVVVRYQLRTSPHFQGAIEVGGIEQEHCAFRSALQVLQLLSR